MGFFDRKKIRKAEPAPVPANHPAPSRYATSTTQTPQYWHPPPPYPNQQYPVQHPQHQQPIRHPPNRQYQQPIVVNQHYYITPPSSAPLALPAPPRPGSTVPSSCPVGLDKFTGPVATIAKDFTSPQFFDEPNFHPHATQLINSTAACVDQIAGCFNDVTTMIDGGKLSGHEKALFTYQQQPAPSEQQQQVVPYEGKRSGGKSSSSSKKKKESHSSNGQGVAESVASGSYFSKVDMYANARLPLNLPPLRLYMPTWPLLCMAAQYAERVYETPKGAERDTHVNADWKHGTKAMVIKSVPMDHMNTIVFAIRGSATFMDWAVNLNTAHASPTNFLDDPGNFCHAGFLTVARRMVKPVAARLRQLLEEDPARSGYSLLITGHSAGGAVASLLYAHMLATSKAAQSELNVLTGCFKRVHCVTFGTPPVSLLPLKRPERAELRKSLFLTFVNEGDPIARADKAYVKSLLELLASPAPSLGKQRGGEERERDRERERKVRGVVAKASKISLRGKESSAVVKEEMRAKKPVWELPACTLSSPGRIVVLRSGDKRERIKDRKTVEERLNEGVVAQTVTDEELRGVIWGDPVCHVMKLYSGRIEILAVGAVTGRHG
ncbi:lipase class 3 [Colletotrichum asianum]|uniref:Lipase class 3 n=1 Tax=Colletotrichum asianum TaxID=702518 RepID=A0A8H3WIN5_9PEZI|nr:lipase class 3 [Colletotrichum asianum]